MKFHFQYILESNWSPLAWVAECSESRPVINVRHGPSVEIRDAWFCEAVWDGEFDAGDFDRTDLIFGSGGRLRDGRVVFVSSGSTVDRLQFLRLDGRLLVSISLACLLAVSKFEVDPTYQQYPEFFRSIVNGIGSYEKRLPTQSGSVELVYFRNLAWDGHLHSEEDKPAPQRDFSCFSRYQNFLRSSLKKIADNMRTPARGHSYEMVSGLSSGYDSNTVAVLAHEVGLRRAFSFRLARGGSEDHGQEVARILGLDLTMFERGDWRRQALAEVPYFAATGLGPDVIFSAAQEMLRGQVLITGFHGDKVWAKDTTTVGPDVVRLDASGLSFTEHRLVLGCIHLPVAFMGVRQIREINALSNAPEMAPWDVPGEYSRPICRRIVEESGVPRASFGMSKKAATNLFRQGEALLSDETRADYYRWLLQNEERWRAYEATKPKVPGSAFLALQDCSSRLGEAFRRFNRFLPPKVGSGLVHKSAAMERWFNRRSNLVQYLFPWAIEQMERLYLQTSDGHSDEPGVGRA
jgi:hypothetical protein